jgi:elongation factor G
MLYEAGIIKRRGSVEEKNTVSDYNEVEHERGNSVFSTLINLGWQGNKINLIDTPGFDDFVGEVLSALKVADTAVMVLNAQFGVEVGSELYWEAIRDMKKPAIIAVNQLDHENADFDRTVEQARSRFGKHVTVVQYPLFDGKAFTGIVDVLKMVYYKFGPEGGKPEKLPIPESEKERADQLHNELVEASAENDDALMELYFAKGSLDEDELRKGLHIGLLKHELFPLFCLSAKNNMGSGRLMGFIGNVAPSAAEIPPAELADGKVLVIDPKGPPVAFVFKTISEPHLGELSFFKVYSGELKEGVDLVNDQTAATERLNQLFTIRGKNREGVTSLIAGDIGASVKLKATHTNNTLHLKGKDVRIKPIVFPDPRVRVAIVSASKGDEEKLAGALHHIREEDPTLNIEHSQELKQTILHGQGELHLAVAKWKIEHLYKLQVKFERPRIPYRETIQRKVESMYRHKKQTGGAGQFAEVHMRVEPYYDGMPKPTDLTVRNTDLIELDWGGRLSFNNCIVGGAIDNKFMNAILKGIMEKMQNGPLTGSYVRDVRVCIFDGKMHAVDSNDQAFKTASLMAFRDAFRDADPKILEPVYELEVSVPEDHMGDVMGDLQTRRGSILGMDADGHYQKIMARVPLMELHNYSSSLRSITQGRAKYKMRFAEYEAVPYEIQQKLIESHAEVEEVA